MSGYATDRRRFLTGLTGAGLLATSLSGCGMLNFSKELEEETVITPVAVDQDAMLAMLNAYRAQKGKSPLLHDRRLDLVSADMARHIAEKDSMDTWAHSPFGLSQRLDKAGYANYAGAENLGAGYASLQAAFAGWQKSPDHNKNLLNIYVTRVGIARMSRNNGKWRNFWVMTLSRPQEDGRPVVR
ncbi:CAP domain-containing protein [Roseibium suaedae]|uniref:Cysteine-rich secretory protein family protein n=1 Tax=Roseibium suaedae TaxID=735517 RepID=A0A1M7PDA4_9HYPH|nr:CAP domain-containing protein [Roseibium suaedae]SHN14896.1 Cysteine-rich secretory protein family protein [Roseibium suaedae]